MKRKIDETLKKLVAGMPNGEASNPTNNKTEIFHHQHDLPGDPNCHLCGGIGFLRSEVPVGHPDFGKLEICVCRRGEISQQISQRLFALSNLEELKQLTFENFRPRGNVGLAPVQADSLERAFNQARHFAETLEGWLLLQGDYGCGKTHLAAAIANFAVGLGVPTLFLTVPDLLDSLRFAYQDPDATFESRFEDVRQASLLVLDDFGTQNATPWAQEKLFQILNYRYINHLPLVVTTNLALDEIEGRIRSRLEDPELVTVVRMDAPDYRRPTGDMGHPELSYLELMHKCTFATFDLRSGEGLKVEDKKSLERAFLAAREFAENPRGWLVFSGTYGCGKTHLAAAIANYRADLGYPPLFISVPDLLDHFRATFNSNSPISLDRLFIKVRSCSLLILDDLGAQSMTPWVKEKLYQLFNHRYIAEKATVITTSDYKNEMDPRLLSRMEDTRMCSIYGITAPSFRGIKHQEFYTDKRKDRSSRK